MALSLDCDLELGLPAPTLQDCDTPMNKDACGTPFSQASTAPSTPFRMYLPEAGKLSPFRLDSGEQGSPMLASDLGKWARQTIDAEQKFALPALQSDLGRWSRVKVETEERLQMPALQSEIGRWSRHIVETEERLGMPSLHSELGRWAQSLVTSKEWREFEESLDSPCAIASPVLNSGLGRWAQIMVENGVETFLVDNAHLQLGLSGIAYRKSKRVDDHAWDVQGPAWGDEVEGVDQGDGWLRVGELYLPMVLEGMCVLTANPDSVVTESEDEEQPEAQVDGPALTPNGSVVDLDGGKAIFFSTHPLLAASHSCKQVMINAAKAAKEARLFEQVCQADADVESEAVCSIDTDGVVRGAPISHGRRGAWCVDKNGVVRGVLCKDAAAATAERIKKFHSKGNHRKDRQNAQVLSIDSDGKAFVFLYLADRVERLREKRSKARRTTAAPATVMSIDLNGVLHHHDE